MCVLYMYILYIRYIAFYHLLCVWVCAGSIAQHGTYVRSVCMLSLPELCPRDGVQVSLLGHRHLYLWNHLLLWKCFVFFKLVFVWDAGLMWDSGDMDRIHALITALSFLGWLLTKGFAFLHDCFARMFPQHWHTISLHFSSKEKYNLSGYKCQGNTSSHIKHRMAS